MGNQKLFMYGPSDENCAQNKILSFALSRRSSRSKFKAIRKPWGLANQIGIAQMSCGTCTKGSEFMLGATLSPG